MKHVLVSTTWSGILTCGQRLGRKPSKPHPEPLTKIWIISELNRIRQFMWEIRNWMKSRKSGGDTFIAYKKASLSEITT
jgi:hypothetical protein